MRKPAWLAEVIVQSIAIVISILLALWVDQWKQRSAAHELEIVSVSNFLKEVHQNEARLDDILPYHKGVRSMLARLATTNAVKTQTDFENAVGVDGLRPPSLLQTAWQTAVATGALTKLDYETVSALSLTYTLQDRFREDARTGFQTVLQASNFGPGGAQIAVRSAVIYLREVVTNEEDLRATYAQAEQVLRAKLKTLDASIPPDSASAPQPQVPDSTATSRP